MAKAPFSVAETCSAGVDVIERSFRSVLVWAAVMFVVTLLPAIVGFLVLGGQFVVPDGGLKLSGLTDLKSGLSLRPNPQMLGAHMLGGIGVILWTAFGAAVVYAAIYRTTWTRQGGKGANLRLGAVEVWLFLLILIQWIALFVAIMVGWIALFALFLLGALAGPPASSWVEGVGMAAIVLGFLWVGLRLSLAQAMTVAEGRFHLFGSWTLTRGRSWKLFWTFWLLLSLAVGVEFLNVMMLQLGLLFATGVVNAATLGATHLEFSPEWVIPIGLIWLAAASLVGALLRTLLVAPLGAAYKALKA